MSILTTPSDEPRFCPGCPHLHVLEELAAAIDRMRLRPEDICLVTDVGCVGLADRYLNSHTFHGLHGRSVTYAEGIKRVRPDRTVIVLMGEGACGIGATHVIHAARRGVGIHVIVCNNLRRGSGAGQYMIRTPGAGEVIPLPDSVAEHPFDICQVAMANGASHVGRFRASDPDFGRHLEDALRATGFVLVECWETCVGPVARKPELTPDALEDLAQRLGLPFGLLHQGGPRWRPGTTPELPSGDGGVSYRATRPLKWHGRAEIWVAGSDAQCIDFAAAVIGGLATAGGLFAVESGDRPIVGGGGYSVASLILSDRPIRHIGCDDPELVVVLSTSGERRLGSLGNLTPKCLVVADTNVPLTPTRARVARIDRRAFETEAGEAWAALATLAFGLAERGLVDAEGLLLAAEANVTGRLRSHVLEALRLGVERVRRTPAKSRA